ncbi:MAG: hypothetical protein LBM75_07750 [Myxococcales bacterium]|jgi:oligoendopeptidase F|nr:hypothetical protein [Myxococcales bacterium]
MAADNYDDLIFTLGDIAYERYWNRPGELKSIELVLEVAETLEHHQLELQELEAAMDDEEQAFKEFQAAVEEEAAQCQELVEQHIKPVKLAESKAKAIESSLLSKRKDLGTARQNLSKLEKQIKQWRADGYLDKAKDNEIRYKSLKMDLLKRGRECEELQTKYDSIMNPDSGPGIEGIRARRRQIDLQQQLDQRSDDYNERMQELEDQAAQAEQNVSDAQRDYEDRIMDLGEEVYRKRLADPALAAFYPRIDKLARQQ